MAKAKKKKKHARFVKGSAAAKRAMAHARAGKKKKHRKGHKKSKARKSKSKKRHARFKKGSAEAKAYMASIRGRKRGRGMKALASVNWAGIAKAEEARRVAANMRAAMGRGRYAEPVRPSQGAWSSFWGT